MTLFYNISDSDNYNIRDFQALKTANKNYKVARSKALKGVKVKVIAPERFHDWNERNKKKGGQVKMERVMGEDKFADWESFINA